MSDDVAIGLEADGGATLRTFAGNTRLNSVQLANLKDALAKLELPDQAAIDEANGVLPPEVETPEKPAPKPEPEPEEKPAKKASKTTKKGS